MNSKLFFYSAVTLIFLACGWLLEPTATQHFLASWRLWYEPVLAGIVCGLLCALLGVYMLWNRIVFVSLAITQGAGLGIFLAFFIAGCWGLPLEHSPLALIAGLLVSSATAFLFVTFKRNKRHSDEVLIGLIYVIASGLIVFIGDRIAEGKHAIDNLLFGNAVAVTHETLLILCAVAAVIFSVHFLWRRELLYVAADADFMKVSGLKTERWLLLLYLTLSVGITMTMKTLGSLPVFSLMVIPPFLALQKANNLRESVLVALLLGTVIPPLGYYLSFLYEFPTGASIIVVGTVYILANRLKSTYDSAY